MKEKWADNLQMEESVCCWISDPRRWIDHVTDYKSETLKPYCMFLT
jgi:hypothetical protein